MFSNKKLLTVAVFLVILLVTVILPLTASAQLYRPGSPVGLEGLAENVAIATWIIFTVFAVVMFVVAGIQFMTTQGDPEKAHTARMSVIWGVVGVAVGILAYSIINIIKIALF